MLASALRGGRNNARAALQVLTSPRGLPPLGTVPVLRALSLSSVSVSSRSLSAGGKPARKRRVAGKSKEESPSGANPGSTPSEDTPAAPVEAPVLTSDPFAVPWASSHVHSEHTRGDIGRIVRVGRHPQVASLKEELEVATTLLPEGHPAMEESAKVHFFEAARAGDGGGGGAGGGGGGGGGSDQGSGQRVKTAQWYREEFAGPEAEYLPTINHDNLDGPTRTYPSTGPGSPGGEEVPLWVQGLAQIPDTYIGVLIREDMLDISERLEAMVPGEPRTSAPDTYGLLLTGDKGRGKSTSLAYAVCRARERGWLTLFNRATHDWTHTQAFVPPCPVTPGLFRLPAVEFDLIDSMRDAQADLLGSLPARSDYAREVGDKTLLEVATRALADIDAEDYPESMERSSRSVAAFFAELRLCVDAPVLVALDEFASLYDLTEYTTGTNLRQIPAHGSRRIEATELTVLHHIERTIKEMARGAFVGALSSGPIPRRRGLEFRADKVRGFPLERVRIDTTPEEAVAIARMWHHQGQLSLRPTDEDLRVLYGIGGRNLHVFKETIDRHVANALEPTMPSVFNLDKPEMRRWFGGQINEAS